MMDNKTAAERSANMAKIHSKNSSAEMIVRQLLFGLGCRYRLHRKDMPGCPDILMPKRRSAVFVHGCFWHQHNGCRYAVQPKSNQTYWKPKLLRNQQRDTDARDALISMGWRVLWIWECGIKRKKDHDALRLYLSEWLKGDEPFAEYPLIEVNEPDLPV